MRIQVATDTWGLVGGSERYAGEVVSALVERGHTVSVLAGRSLGAAMDRVGPRPAVPVDLAPGYGAHRPTAPELDELEACVRRRAPDVLLVLSLRSLRAARRLASLRVPTVRFVQDHTLFCPGLNKLYADGSPCTTSLGATCLEQYYLRAGCTGHRREQHQHPWLDGTTGVAKKLEELDLASRSARLLVASRYMRRELITAGQAPDRVHVLPYFTRSNSPHLPSTPLPASTRRFLEADDTPLVFCPARLALPDKGVDLLIDALGLAGSTLRAVIAGDGPAEQELRARAAPLGPRVHFAGWLDAGSIESMYARADLVAFPSVWDEPFGLVGLEAMAHAKPVVAFDVGGVGEWLRDGGTGRLVPRGDVTALAGALGELAQDPDRARRLGAAGRASLAREFDRERHLDQLEAHLTAASRA